jgi:serine/threonine protein kinase
MSCPNTEELTAFNLGRMPDERSDEVARHADTCPLCAAALRELGSQEDELINALRDAATGQTLSSEPAVPAEAQPARVGVYEIRDVLGRGGMGVVYQAYQGLLNRPVALKMLREGTFADASARARFLAEARAVARLQHPHIVQVYEIGEHQGAQGESYPYFTLELVNGGNLDDYLEDRPVEPQQAARWTESLARALQYAHEQGIVHRDLKPANILLQKSASGAATELVPKLTDFGIAKWLAGSEMHTRTGMVLGTPEYMAPEQATGSCAVSPAMDIYALGAALYQMLTGRPPFRGLEPLHTLTLAVSTEPVPPRRLQPSVPRDLETICLKCLQKDPAGRYATAGQLADDLGRFGSGEPVLARPVPVWGRAWRWARRRPALAALIVLAGLVVLVGLPGTTVLWLRADRERAAKEVALDQANADRLHLEDEAYAAHLALAAGALEANDVLAAGDELGHCLLPEGRRDLRGWEWYYLLRQCQTDVLPGLAHPEPHSVAHAVGFLPDSRRLFSAGGLVLGLTHDGRGADANPGQLKIWDGRAGSLLNEFEDHRGSVFAAAVSPDGRWLASAGADGTVVLRDAATLEVVPGPPPAKPGWGALAFAPNSRWLAVARGAELLVWDVAARRPKLRLPTTESRLAFSSDSRRLAVTRPPDVLTLWDVETGR